MDIQKFTFIKADKKLVKIYFDEITYIKALGNYIEIHSINNSKLIYYKSMKDIINNLPKEFMRIHNSYIVNLTNVTAFEDNHILLAGFRISVGKSYRECLSIAFSKYLL